MHKKWEYCATWVYTYFVFCIVVIHSNSQSRNFYASSRRSGCCLSHPMVLGFVHLFTLRATYHVSTILVIIMSFILKCYNSTHLMLKLISLVQYSNLINILGIHKFILFSTFTRLKIHHYYYNQNF